MFNYTSKNGRLTVYEGASAFYLIDNNTGNEVCLGDGVDMFSNSSGESLLVGGRMFYFGLRNMVDALQMSTLEEYFLNK